MPQLRHECQLGVPHRMPLRQARKAAEQKATESGKSGAPATKSPSKSVGGTGLRSTLAPWAPEAKEMAKMQNQLRQLLAENKKLKKVNGGEASDMEVDQGDDEDNVAEASSIAQRTELQAKITKYEQTIKMHKDDGEDELATKLQAQSLRTPAMAHKHCTQKLQRVQKQISTAKHDLQSLQQKMEKVQKEMDEKKDFLESKLGEEQVLTKQLAGHAAKLSGCTAEAGVEVPPDILRLDPEIHQLKSDPDLLQFYNSFSANPLFANMEELYRQNMAAKLAQELHRAMYQGKSEGAVSVSPEQLAEMVADIQNTKHRKFDSGGALVPSEVNESHFVETYNANQGKQTLKKRLSCTRFLIVLAQEIGYHDWECEALSSWCATNKWNVMGVPGAPTAGKLPAAGLAIFAREGIGLRGPTYPPTSPAARRSTVNEQVSFGSELVPHRAQHAVVEVPGWPPINIFNIYLHTGEGMSLQNAKILVNVGLAMAGQTYPSIIGGDWNMTAAEIEASSFTVHAQVSLLVPKSITCRTATANSVIDYFARTSGAMRLIKAIQVDMGWAIKPHRPVVMELATMCKRMMYLTYVGGAKIEVNKQEGPMLQDMHDWELERTCAEGAVEMAVSGSVGAAWRLLSSAWARFAAQAATRLGHLTGTPVQAFSYGGYLRPKWVSYMYEGSDPEGIQAVADGWKWYEDALSVIAKLLANRPAIKGNMLQDEIHGFVTTDYAGQGVSQRLDAVVAHARRALAAPNTSAQDIINMIEEAAEDIGMAKQAADRDSA
ncbi:unnamed protein product [Prorocentrum cordatum]|uniref:Uncharacterized protein n=1 Tax=Prorocentrum cordatum TaxID=2364126 RepID=A0ABN9RAR6_9DINO|nr:unnamed protein product [Polarella glacialis]